MGANGKEQAKDMKHVKTLNQEKWEDKKRLAIKYADGERTLKELATIVGCSLEKLKQWEKEVGLKIRRTR